MSRLAITDPNEDEMNNASKNIDDFDDIYEMVEAFEEQAY
mgnify:FL=1|jgi:hypothetical protein